MDDARSLGVGGASTVRDDDERMAAAAAQDPQAFLEIYERYRTAVFRYLRSRTTSDDDAGELSAITFERALTGIHRFRPSGGGLAAWLLRIARNAHIDATRRRSGSSRAPETAGHRAPAPDSPGVEDQIILRSLVDALPDTQRDAIRLRFAAVMTAREIGRVLGISEEAAQKQLERGMRALKEAFRVD
jgi:RNA polymerase sigma-70 factor (ECF subfamily)